MGDRVVKVEGLRSSGAIRMGSIPIPYNFIAFFESDKYHLFDDIYY